MAVSSKATGAKRASQAAGSKANRGSTARKVTTTHSAPAKGTATGQRKSTRKNSAGNRKAAAKQGKSLEEMNAYQDHLAFETGITIFVILIVSVFLYLSYFGLAGNAGIVVGGLFFGIFGWFAWFLPLFCLIGFVFCVVNKGDRRVSRRLFSFGGIVLSLLGLSDLLFQKQIITEYYTSNHVLHRNYFECMFLTCTDVITEGKFNGGLCGRAVGTIFSTIIGRVGGCVILFALLLFCLYIFYGVEMMGMLRKRNAYRQEMKEVYEEISQDENYKEPSYRVFTNSRPVSKRNHFQPREMEKVPKVQTFDLKKMNGEIQPDAEQKKKNVSVDKKTPHTSKSPINPVEEVSGAVKGTGSYKKTEPRDEKNGEAVAAMQEEIATREIQNPIEQIPIYRNELNEKFGKKKKTAKSMVQSVNVVEEPFMPSGSVIKPMEEPKKLDVSPLEPVVEPEDSGVGLMEPADEPEHLGVQPMDETETLNAVPLEPMVEPENLGVEPLKQVEKPEDFGVEPLQSVEKSENLGVESLKPLDKSEGLTVPSIEAEDELKRLDAAQKPMASFAHKEEVTDVTPLSQKLAEEANSVAKTAVAVQPEEGHVVSDAGKGTVEKPKRVSHGKIGGDDYVSASDTFNALNESKISIEKEEIPYEFPPIDLLSLPESVQGNLSDDELRSTASKLQETLRSFNVNVKMGAVTCGPTVTRYELLPEQGVRVNKITNLADDLKLSLAAASIRIEAPIPGKAAVGIEVPNPSPSPVYFRELLEGDIFNNAKSDLTFAVGKDIAGKLIMADIAKMPHLLIAGATGSGKSVCINTLIMSILYKADPKDVKLIMIDPKVVELSVYNGIPHLFCPVVTDPKEAAAALNWAVREMMDRYNKFKELGVRNIAGYNEKIKTVEHAEEAGYAKMPYLVVIVDEFADLMMVASKEVEDAVCRLAQLARAAGIHLVLATQRPSVNVITGVIKANIPSRIAFSVSSVIDSRTILDKGGAEKLLGKGDMLFFPSGYSEPVRVQGAFVADKEVSDVVDFLCSNNDTPEYNHSVTEIVEEPKEEVVEKKSQTDRDEYFEDAGRFVIESERAAAGQLQRRFSIGFNRAGRIIDQLNKAGVVGPAEGTKPRKVLMTIEEFERMLSGGGEVSEEEMESMVREMEEEVVTTQEL